MKFQKGEGVLPWPKDPKEELVCCPPSLSLFGCWCCCTMVLEQALVDCWILSVCNGVVMVMMMMMVWCGDDDDGGGVVIMRMVL